MFPSFSYSVLFQRFSPQNISLLPKIVTEAPANLIKKTTTGCNTTLKHGMSKSNFQSDLLAGSIFSIYSSLIHHQSSYGL